MRMRGFTLVELMIVVIVIGILAAIAYPNYIDSVRKSRRALAKSALLEAAQRQESYFARKASYTATLSDLGYTPVSGTSPAMADIKSESGDVYYRLLLEQADATCPLSRCYRITVRAHGDQTSDSIAQFRLWSTGKKQHLPKGASSWTDGWPD